MFLKSIKLTNIRSYDYQEIKFPEGSVMLSGDIGSGKSTILLAIEFALFGTKKGELPAYTLLKHGKREGSAELRMQIDNKDVTVKRVLKRGKDDIKQIAGYVITNGYKKDGTAEELRALILELLGYPMELIKKGKDLIYRYTVYTPQEEMKKILYEDKEVRLETLRKVFNIDRYKRIRDNSKIILTALKEKKRMMDGFILDLEPKKKDLEEKHNEVVRLHKDLERIQPEIDSMKKTIAEKRKSIETIEKEIIELNLAKKNLSVTEANLTNRIEQNNRLNDEIKKLESQIETLNKQLKDKKMEDLSVVKEKIKEKEKETEEAYSRYKEVIRKIKGMEVRMDHSSETIRKITELDNCPVCEQKVDKSHKHNIAARENKKTEEMVMELKDLKFEETNLEKIRVELKKELDGLVKEQNMHNILKIRIENLNERTKAKEEKLNSKERIRKDVGTLNKKKIEFSKKVQEYAHIEDNYKSIKKELDELLPQERFLELEKRKYDTEILSLQKFMDKIEKEIREKLKEKDKVEHFKQLIHWIDEFFVNLMSTMEKHVMVNIHSQFNELFKNWFDVLMEDETINVRIDEEFTPVIEQNGYETYVENLSGGEKTSVALSYRLSLNKVINDIVAEIKTKDIIMLDEPTDGFSSDQLDKVRDVLEQLDMKQIIIVSHEPKIESYVENVIKVNKRENVSVVV